MALAHLYRLLRRNWLLIALPVLVVIIWTAATWQPEPASHFVDLTFHVVPEASETLGETPRGLDFYWEGVEYTAASMADWMSGSLFLERVRLRAEQHAGALDAAAFAPIIASVSSDETRLSLRLWAQDPAALPALGQAAAEVVTQENHTALPQSGGEAVPVLLVNGPRTGTVPSSNQAQVQNLLLRLVSAVVLGIGLCWLYGLSNPVVRSAEDVSLPLLGQIPDEPG